MAGNENVLFFLLLFWWPAALPPVWGKEASLTDRCVGEASAGVRGGLPPGFLQSQSSLRLLLMLFPTLLLSIVIDISMTLPGSATPGAGTVPLVQLHVPIATSFYPGAFQASSDLKIVPMCSNVL